MLRANSVRSGDLFDEPLERAVKAFQAQSELASDGIVGPQTRRVLAGAETETSSEDKIAAVIANMEEWRWMPRDLGAKHVLVNIPSFSIALTNDDRTVFEDRVVVGTPSTQTPIFSKDMTTIVLRPQWYLPDSIKLSTLLGGRPLEGMGYVVMRNGRRVDSSRVDWSKANLKEYEIYQPSGDDNALGLVKLLFPNKHSVYLHDTPSKHLFDQSVRLFSHGCMRVRNPQILAQRIFDIDTHQSTVPDVMRLVRSGPMNNQFTLQTPIPVHVGYFTVWVDDNGEAQFYKDYYGHQKRITLALAGKWNEIDVGVDHLAEVDTSLLRNVKLGSEKKDDDADDKAVARSSDNSINSVGDLIRRSLGL